VDGAQTFTALPDDVVGADYLQASSADRKYSAVDLMELAVSPGSTVWIAHDDRLSRPTWLTGQFQQLGTTAIAVDGKRIHLFVRQTVKAESLTLGSNGEADANMYVVFVQ
jgi:beta-galactosidase